MRLATIILAVLIGAAAFARAAPAFEEFFDAESAVFDDDAKLAEGEVDGEVVEGDGEAEGELRQVSENERIIDDAIVTLGGCCVDNPNRPVSPSNLANYACSQLTTFGPERCKSVFDGQACYWATGKECSIIRPRFCARTPKYEVRFGKLIDVGQCGGLCPTRLGAPRTSCTPRDTVPVDVNGNTVMVIKSCECSTCATLTRNVAVEIPSSVCSGRCAGVQTARSCTAGVADNFSTANGPEPSSPSTALLTGPLSMCSAGVQTGFDIFADNKCFGHTFSNCITRGPCPLRSANVRFCIRAANVPLTHTDSLALGTNGVFHWGITLPALNNFVSGSNTWNQGAQLCTTLDLTNLPGGGANILPQVEAAGSLDFFVQDDTAVDFITLNIDYVQCQVCAPKVSVVSTLYTPTGAQNFVDVKDCSCHDTTQCRRESLYQTFFPGTIFEATIDVGQCIGRCGSNTLSRCRSVYSSKKELKAPEGVRVIEVIEKCDCNQNF